MRRVVLESPYAGAVAENVAYAKRAVLDCLKRDEAPIASHLLFTQRGVLLDSEAEERQKGISAGHAWVCVAESLVVYVDRGVSGGMKQGIKRAVELDIPVEFRALDGALSDVDVAKLKEDCGVPE